MRSKLGVSERRACRVLRQHRTTQRRVPVGRADEAQLVEDMIALTRRFGRFGYRRIAVMLRSAGWEVNDKRVERLWRREGLKVPMKQPKKGRLWLNPFPDIAVQCPAGQWMGRAFVELQNIVIMFGRTTLCTLMHARMHCRVTHHRTDDGKAFRTLNILDEFSRECLQIRVKRKLNSTDVIDALTDLFILRGVPKYIRSDNGPEFIAEAVRNWINAVGSKTAYIEPHSQ